MSNPEKHPLRRQKRLSDFSDGGRKERASGIVQNVDLVGRDLKVLVQANTKVFDVPPDCPIFLHGEQVKLRMVQPDDYVRITFKYMSERLVAEKLEIQPDSAI